MKISGIKTLLGTMIAIIVVCMVLLVIVLVKLSSVNKQLENISTSQSATTTNNDSTQLSALQNSVDGINSAVNTIKFNTLISDKPISLSCSGSTFSYGSTTGSISLSCN
ncbi:MAG TPA: hypothetical protein VMV24_01085 [Candidatus Dormibacteraeota bacterium]|nr:hypothetical protein [Candidatus Dormibacteraeota bacterium]